ncbi:MAG: hypothetical protein PHI98_17210, partial [Eubacteriales bacterium]|nr:hypothetical protein [Eubacteriales bacterium]
RELSAAMRKAENGEYDGDNNQYEIDPAMAQGLEALADKAEQAGSLREMNAQNLRELSKWTTAMRHAVATANEFHDQSRRQTIDQGGESTIAELGTRKSAKQRRGALRLMDELLNADMLDAWHFFKQLGGAAEERYQALREGFNKQIRYLTHASEYMKEATEGINVKALGGKNAKKQTFELGGGTLELTKAGSMELYELSKRKQAQKHLYEVGVVLKEQGVDTVHLTEADVQTITDTLTDAEKALADKMQRYMSRVCAQWGNEASMQLYGYEKFGERDYYPIRVDQNTVDTKNTDQLSGGDSSGLYRLKNMGMTKAVQENASNPLIIGDIFDTFTRHVDDMSRYGAYVVAAQDMMRWYNYRNGEYNLAVKKSVERAYGKKGQEYILRLIKDINGETAPSNTSEKVFNKLTSNAKAAAVGFNLRVVVQQPMSYARAAAEINPKYLAMGIGKPQIELAKKYCPIAQWKSWGNFDISTGRSMREMIVGDQTVIEKAREAGTKLAGAA